MMLLTAEASLNDAGQIHNGFVDDKDIVTPKNKTKCAGLCVLALSQQFSAQHLHIFIVLPQPPPDIAKMKGYKIQPIQISQTASNQRPESTFITSFSITNTITKHLKITTWRL